MKRRRKSLFAVLVITFAVFFPAGCGRKHKHVSSIPQTPQPLQTGSRKTVKGAPAVPVGYTEEGVASWYGVPYHGRPAADGEIYDMETLVAAHRVLPFNTWLRVTNLNNGKTVDVRVIDRGPFVKGRILDLSKAAARSIDLLGPGIGRIRFEVVSSPRDMPVNDFYAVQVGAFSTYERAENLRRQYAERFGNAQLALKQGATPLWRVLVGKESSTQAAQQLSIVLGAENKNVFVVRLDETVLKSGANSTSPAASPAQEPAP